MSQRQILYTCHELVLDKQGNCLKEYETNLPHHDMIAKEMADSWNSTNIVRCFDGILKDKIASAKMKVKKIKDDTVAVITVIGKPNIRFSQTITNEIYDQIDAQFSDGWGEGFFGYINIMTADDGTIFCVE